MFHVREVLFNFDQAANPLKIPWPQLQARPIWTVDFAGFLIGTVRVSALVVAPEVKAPYSPRKKDSCIGCRTLYDTKI